MALLHNYDHLWRLQDLFYAHYPAHRHLNTDAVLCIEGVCKLLTFPPIFKLGSTRDFKHAGFMLRNLFGSHVPSGLLLLEDAQSIQIKETFCFIGSMPL